VGRQQDIEEGRRRFNNNSNNNRLNKPETNNAMVSNNWRRKD
jgi:hypothetical protein